MSLSYFISERNSHTQPEVMLLLQEYTAEAVCHTLNDKTLCSLMSLKSDYLLFFFPPVTVMLSARSRLESGILKVIFSAFSSWEVL